MKRLHFYKYQGTGNDFVLIDNRNNAFDGSNNQLIGLLCQRRFGIGADGLMLMEASQKGAFAMRYFNSDGREALMCGNGGLCMAAFAVHLGLVPRAERFEFEAADGLHEAEVRAGDVTLKMKDVKEVKQMEEGYFMDTGSPNFVRFVDNPAAVDVAAEGSKWSHHRLFAPEGTNVNFVRTASRSVAPMRTYERGVEGETWSCGTGAVASAIAVSLKTGTGRLFRMQVPGGELTVSFDTSQATAFTNIWLTGPAVLVFEGNIDIE